MDVELHQKLIENTETLRALLTTASTESVVGMCVAHSFSRYASNTEDTALVSPLRQQFYLLGLLLTTQEPAAPKEFGSADWQQSVNLLNEIFNSYAWMFWPRADEVPSFTEQWTKIREVAMPAFLHYFNTGILASVEQVSERISLYLSPFDDLLENEIGISASDALCVADWLAKDFQEILDEVREASSAEQKARLTLLDEADREKWSMQRLRQEARGTAYIDRLDRLMSGIQTLFKISHNDLRTQFGQTVADAFWNTFVSKRGEVQGFTYLTERNIAEEKPLFQLNEEVAICPFINTLYNAILGVGEHTLSSGERQETFFKKRDKTLEQETEQLMRLLFGGSATYLSSVYENPELQYEHDLIVKYARTLLVVEAKATPPIEPFRDPDRAFTRIKRAFQSDRGIQKAYDQANRIRSQLRSGNSLNLYDGERHHVASLQSDEFDEIYCVCVTRDNFGALAVDLSLLLEKREEDSYPWAVNIFDLGNIVDAWGYFQWGADRFSQYLEARTKLHGKVFSTDELEVVGFFVRHGDLHWLVDAQGDRIFMTPDYSDVFDQIYLARKGGDPVSYSPIAPVMGNMRQMLTEAEHSGEQPSNTVLARKKQGRNERCACGSGKKYKWCCGKRT